MFDSVRSHRWQPTRLLLPWDSLGKNTGVGHHFLLQNMEVKSESEVAQSCPTLRDPMECSLPGSSIHGIFQARILERVASAFSVSSIKSFIFYLTVVGPSCGPWMFRVAMHRHLLLQPVGSLVMFHRLSCPMACGILVPQPGIEV